MLMQPAYSQQDTDIEAMLKEGKEAYLNGEYNEAIEKLSVAVRFLRVKDDLVDANIILALVHLTLGDNKNSEKFIKDALKIKPDLVLSAAEYSPKFITLAENIQKTDVITTIFKIAGGGILYLNGFQTGEGKFLEVKVFKGENNIKVMKEGFEAFQEDLLLTDDGGIKEIELRLKDVPRNGVIEKPGTKKKKKFPWLIVVGGIIVLGALLYFLVLKKPKFNLTTTWGEGVGGSPASGSTSYNKNETVIYNFVAQQGYTNLTVKLDGQEINASGIIKMDKNHKLEAVAVGDLGPQHALLVIVGNGIDGNPGTGSYTYNENQTVSYDYKLKNDYKDLLVKLDGTKVGPKGTITMDRAHTLHASAVPTSGKVSLTVNKGNGVQGSPTSGISTHSIGDRVNYNYTVKSGYTDLVVKLDGQPVSNSGSITMDRDHTLNATASTSDDQMVLTVDKGDGVSGTPNKGTHKYGKGAKVNYNYKLESGYTNLKVKLDGKTVSSSGTITMNTSHNLTASATSNLGSINITSKPSGATIYLDGQDSGHVTPDTLTNITAGTHTITLKKKNFKDATGQVEVIAGQTVNFHLELQKL